MRESCLTITPETHFQDFCFSSPDLGLAGSGDLVSNGGMLLGALPGLVALGAKAAPSHCGLLISLAGPRAEKEVAARLSAANLNY